MEVSYGTNVGRTLEHYKEIPMSKMHYGQALAMLVLIEGLEEHANNRSCGIGGKVER